MAKLKTDKIEEKDLKEYLGSYSDFSFELSVLKMLRESGVECEHGGHYQDPVTNKSREFDIRAMKTFDSFRLRMAIECKNIRENFPVLVSCIPRHKQESYHQIAFVREPTTESVSGFTIPTPIAFRSRAAVLSIRGDFSLYNPGEPVGKSTVQVGRAQDGTISAHDSELYEKWGQCLGSANDLVERMYWDGDEKEEKYISTVIPFVVVPDDRLWMVVYDEDGNMTGDPKPTDRCSCFIDKEYEMGNVFCDALKDFFVPNAGV